MENPNPPIVGAKRVLVVALVALSLYQAFGALWALRVYRGRTCAPDKVTVYLKKFNAVKFALSGVARAGYISDRPDWAYKKLAQYSFPGTVLEENRQDDYLLGNFHGPVLVPDGYSLFAQSSGGAAVFIKNKRSGL